MGTQRKNREELDYNSDAAEAFLYEADLDIDDDEFFQMFEEKQSQQRKNNRKRDARRRIEDYWDRRRLADSLDEYYLHLDD